VLLALSAFCFSLDPDVRKMVMSFVKKPPMVITHRKQSTLHQQATRLKVPDSSVEELFERTSTVLCLCEYAAHIMIACGGCRMGVK
jgi:hypothetical protein